MKAFKSAVIIFVLSWTACGQRQAVKTPKSAPASERAVIVYQGEDGKTALEILKARARVRTSNSQLGELVEEINGVNNRNGHYLIYYVNGAMAKVGAGSYITKTGDKIEWKLIGPR